MSAVLDLQHPHLRVVQADIAQLRRLDTDALAALRSGFRFATFNVLWSIVRDVFTLQSAASFSGGKRRSLCAAASAPPLYEHGPLLRGTQQQMDGGEDITRDSVHFWTVGCRRRKIALNTRRERVSDNPSL
jgi:hypothetical protein